VKSLITLERQAFLGDFTLQIWALGGHGLAKIDTRLLGVHFRALLAAFRHFESDRSIPRRDPSRKSPVRHALGAKLALG